MYCSACGTKKERRSNDCPGCGSKFKSRFSFVSFMAFICLFTAAGFGGVIFYLLNSEEQAGKQAVLEPISQETDAVMRQTVAPPKTVGQEEQRVLTDIIAATQQNVYTIFTDYGQGSGFLINEKGDIATNAHVVEGTVYVIVKDIDGIEHEGRVIGYSNKTDIALVRVPDLAGRPPLPVEQSEQAKVGEEVIALGSPLALENTATFGYITGVGRSFIIDPHSYENVYQTSAAIAPGSSGGPLLSKNSGRVLAINSAKLNGEDAIGFSIPYKDVAGILNEWSSSPLSEDEVTRLFYTEEGLLFFEEHWNEDAYFDGGDYSEDESYDFYDIPEDWWYTEEPLDETDIGEEYTEDGMDNSEYHEEDPEEILEENLPSLEPGLYEGEIKEDLPVIEEEMPFEEEVDKPLLEDVNGDGVIDVNDVTEDVNRDGLIDELDLEELIITR